MKTKDKIVLIGASDSIGVPYSRDNKDKKGFFELFESELTKTCDVISINCFHMSTYNDNKYIKSIIDNNYSLKSVKTTQNEMLRKCKYSGIYPFLEMPKNFLNHYKVDENDEKIRVCDMIRNNKTIFVYSAFVNDILKARKLSLFKLLKPGRIKKELEYVDIEVVLATLEENISSLIGLNPNIKIYIIGLFVPTKFTFIRENLKNLIIRINYSLQGVSKKYKENVFFVDNGNLDKKDFNNIDFHPNKKGHRKIFENLKSVYLK